MVGMMAASPDGQGFSAVFEEFKVKSLQNPGL
jgi:regulation of enolase protein 1 (concanavalin A-like superfamily)